MSIELYEPITKERASAILQVSIRSLDHWVQQGYMPAATKIGRQCYWHPTDFYAWLNARLNHVPTETAVPLEENRQSPVATLQEAPGGAPGPAPVPTPKAKKRIQHSDAKSARERNRMRIAKLNAAPDRPDSAPQLRNDPETNPV